MIPLWIVAVVFLAGLVGFVGAIVIVLLAIREDRDEPRETLYLTVDEQDPARGYALAQAVRRYEAGARG